ncbi:HMG (high mobility group) box protein [Rhizoctonia solani AG-3 Rhs1AP]|uniref:HMG (High mobility group) box protein n=1 Tax=Rhizoctonia solani AG-3 Rhs1AP TaxID=1086054 RepID=X8IXS7_9AGAM|nr:HMG (high mobility group) box protein [Rhizoctonia solani AG-3 Rhs1AP]
MGYTALKPIDIVAMDTEQVVIPYQRRTRRAMRETAAMPPTRPDRPRPTPASSSTGNGKAQPPRPPNAWILYRSDKLKELATSQPPGPRKPQAEISKIISQLWQAEGPETKGMYEARAEEKKAEHAALYPDYKFAPMKKEDKAIMRKAQRLEKEEIRAAERNRKKRKGKGRADDDDEEYDTPRALPYPLQRPAQSWYPPSTYGPQGPRYPPAPHDDQGAFAAAGWSAAVDPQGQAPEQDTPFRADAYQQQPDEGEEEWAGEEGEWGAEEAWAGRSRRGAVWHEEQIAGPSEYQEDPITQWTSISTSPPPQTQPPSLTITLPATLNPSEQPYTFNLDFDMPMATFAGDPDANVAVSLGGMNLSESSSANPNVGLNDLLRAPLPDIAVSFPDFVGNADGHGNFDVLSTENEEWWSALMEAAIIPDDSRSYAESGPSHLMAGPSYDSAGPSRPSPIHTQSLPTFAHGLPSPDGDHQGGRSRAASSAAYPGQMPGAFPEQYESSYQPTPACSCSSAPTTIPTISARLQSISIRPDRILAFQLETPTKEPSAFLPCSAPEQYLSVREPAVPFSLGCSVPFAIGCGSIPFSLGCSVPFTFGRGRFSLSLGCGPSSCPPSIPRPSSASTYSTAPTVSPASRQGKRKRPRGV